MTPKQWRLLIELGQEDLAQKLDKEEVSNEDVFKEIDKLLKNNKQYTKDSNFKLFHYSNDLYNKGENIKKNSQLKGNFVNEIKEAYGDLSDNLIYALNEENEDYAENYLYKYEIDGKPFKRFMDYSPMLLNIELNNENGAFNKYSNDDKKEIIKLFALAYKGDDLAKDKLETKYNYSLSDKIEYIMKEAKVK